MLAIKKLLTKILMKISLVGEYKSAGITSISPGASSISVETATYKSVVKLDFPANSTWMVTCRLRFPSNATGRRLTCAGGSVDATNTHQIMTNAVSGGQTCHELSFPVNVGANGATTYLNAWQNSGGALNISSASMYAVRIR